uniref:NADH-ubiquinone oxidoreductase chain 5 n=1 Tax=Halocynthia roretzi TaxID=7729 RepID=Q9T9H1_HALRO|nr:NADH dehydrogenase subunit 5 [Halocynthia roretzi]BAA88259.1 NADH dehydrogenase subunit 5 [Halocynthia roretzi]
MLEIFYMYVLVYLCGLLLLGQLLVLLTVGLNNLSGFLVVVVKIFYKAVVGILFFVFVWIMCYGGFIGGEISLGSGLWLGASLDFLIDFYTICFYLVAGVVSWSILEFGFSYVGGEPQFGKFSWMLLCFLFFMMCLVVAGKFLMLFLGWEGVGLLSFVLISWWCNRESAVGSSIQAVLYNRVGWFWNNGLVVLFVISGVGFGLNDNEGLTFGFGFLLLAIMAKSSQFLFHPWLPNAMEGPTPVSSLLHSSTMVVAGVSLLIRVVESVDCMGLVMLVGAVTSFSEGLCAIGQFDFKKVVAFSTTSQLGFMVFTVGLGYSYLAFFHVLMHAFFKAMFLMVSGEMIHARQNIQDLRELGHGELMMKRPGFLLILGSGVMMMGFPFLSGFFTKDLVMESFFGGFLNRWVFFLFLFSVLFTCGYSTWIIGKMLISWGWGCSVVLGMEGMLGPFFLYRPYLLAICGGVLVWGWMGDFAESYVVCLVKVGPLIIFGVGSFCGALLVLWRAQLVSGFAFYLGFFNPLVHKFMIYLSQVWSFFSLYCDYLILEMILPRGWY